MNPSDYVLIICVSILLALTMHLYFYWPKRVAAIRDLTEVEVQLCETIRLTMQDLESRDPQLAEHMQIGYIELDRMEAQLRRTTLALSVLKKGGI